MTLKVYKAYYTNTPKNDSQVCKAYYTNTPMKDSKYVRLTIKTH